MRGTFLFKKCRQRYGFLLLCGLNVQSNNFVLFTKQLIRYETVHEGPWHLVEWLFIGETYPVLGKLVPWFKVYFL